jgi:hypothetical protein
MGSRCSCTLIRARRRPVASPFLGVAPGLSRCGQAIRRSLAPAFGPGRGVSRGRQVLFRFVAGFGLGARLAAALGVAVFGLVDRVAVRFAVAGLAGTDFAAVFGLVERLAVALADAAGLAAAFALGERFTLGFLAVVFCAGFCLVAI